MFRVRHAAAVVLALLLCACASQLHNEVYFTPDVDFSSMRNLAFSGAGGGSAANREVARKAIQSALESKGFRFGAQPGADLLVHFTMGTRAKVKLSGAATTGEKRSRTGTKKVSAVAKTRRKSSRRREAS